MIVPPETLEGWTPMPNGSDEVGAVIDLAFDYRGDVTVVLADGSQRTGYLFNRQRETREPFVELLESDTTTPVTIRYADIRTIHFTGKDTAAGKSYAAWLERKAARSSEPPAPGA